MKAFLTFDWDSPLVLKSSVPTAEMMAREWGRHDINVCALSPGYIHTDMTATDFEGEGGKKVVERLPRRRVGKVEDLAAALLFLVDPTARLVNGAVVPVDDGLSIG